MSKQQDDAEREAQIADNKKASGDEARKQLKIPAKKKKSQEDQAAGNE